MMRRMRIGHPQHVLYDDFVREADAERESIVRCGSGGECLLRHRDWVTRVGRHNRGSQFDARSRGTDHGQCIDGIKGEYVRHPNTVETGGFRASGRFNQAFERMSFAAGTHHDTNFHRVLQVILRIEHL